MSCTTTSTAGQCRVSLQRIRAPAPPPPSVACCRPSCPVAQLCPRATRVGLWYARVDLELLHRWRRSAVSDRKGLVWRNPKQRLELLVFGVATLLATVFRCMRSGKRLLKTTSLMDGIVPLTTSKQYTQHRERTYPDEGSCYSRCSPSGAKKL